jgi:hypothetical protein
MLQTFHSLLPYQPGYLDRVAAYADQEREVEHRRVSPRMFVVLPWSATIEPEVYRGVADVIWQFELEQDQPVPFGAWRAAGGVGIALRFHRGISGLQRATVIQQAQHWQQETGRIVWLVSDAGDDVGAGEAEQTVYSGRI